MAGQVGAAAGHTAAGIGRLGRSAVAGFFDKTRPPTASRLMTTVEMSPERTRKRLVAVMVVLGLLFGTIVVRMVSLQVLNPAPYEQLSEAQRTRTEKLAADRGAILDRNGVELALSLPQTSVFVDPKLVTDPAGEAARLADVLGADPAEIERKMRADNRFGYVARHLPDDVAAKVRALALPGVAYLEEPRRFTPSGDLASGIVGTTDVDGNGISGLERQYADDLTGDPGKVVIEQTPEGRTIPIGQNQVIPAVKGKDLVLTLDRNLQFDVERILADQVRASGAKGAIAVVSKPATGEVLAMANVRADEKTGEVKPSADNAALTGVYEPGSVMKVVAASGAIEEGKVTPDTVLSLPASMTLGGAEFTDAEARGAVPWPVWKIISESSNIGTIMLGQKLGKEKVVDYLHRFGFGRSTGLGFPNEQRGVVPPAKDWWDSSMGTVPIGQGVSVTPMQMLLAYNVVANGGTYVPPKVVNAVVDGGVKRPTDAGEGHRVISEDTADKMNIILRGVVATGTGTKAAVPGYTVAGKTGTARKPQPGGGYKDAAGVTHYESTFVGFAPAESPEVSVIVIIDDPGGGQIYGGLVAAPAFAKITESALRLLGVPPPSVDQPAGGGPAASGEQAKSAGAAADDTPAYEVAADGRKRALPATDAPGAPLPGTAGPATAAPGGATATTGAATSGAGGATATTRAPATTATTRPATTATTAPGRR
ncbi:MAG: penicillin-binding protein 2 [Acidimicrobiales bacterium]